jgi:hypothetical protein
MSDEPMSDTGNGTLFRIDDSSMEVFDPNTSFTVSVDGSAVSADTYDIHYLTGAVEFDSSKAGSDITITGAYLPTSNVMDAFSTDYSRSYTEIDQTVFEDVGFDRTYGLAECEVTIGHLDSDDYPLDGQSGSEKSLSELLVEEDREIVVEYQPSGLSNVDSGTRQGYVHRAWVKMTSDERSTEVDGRHEASITLTGSERDSVMSTQDVRLFDSFLP